MASKFPEYKSFNLQDINKEMQDKWDREKTFEKSLEKRKDSTPYIFYDGTT